MLDWLKQDPREEPIVQIGKDVLPIVIRRHPTAKRMTLRLSQDGREVRISMPRWGRTADALEFVHSRKDWLARQKASLPAISPVAHGTRIPFRGTLLQVHHCNKARRKPSLDGERVMLGGPDHSVAARLRRWLEQEAHAAASIDLSEYCKAAGREVPSLSISRARRRWGSCAPDGTIRINWRLIMAPDFVRRSVVAHEVAHLVHFDHSPDFHAMLAGIFEGDIADANRWLKKEGRSLYLPFG